MSLPTSASILPSLSWWCIDAAVAHIDAEITKLIIDIDNGTKHHAELLLEKSRTLLYQYFRIGSGLQPPQEALEQFCARVVELEPHSLFVINSILSKYAKKLILSRPIALSQCAIETIAFSFQYGLSSVHIDSNCIGDDFIIALASSKAADSLEQLHLWSCFITDRTSHLWQRFTALSDLLLDDCKNITTISLQAITAASSLTGLSVVCHQLDAVESLRIIIQSQRSLKRLGLHVQAQYVADDDFRPVLDLLRSLESREMLEYLNLGLCKDQSYSHSVVEELLNLFPNLTGLDGNLDPIGRLDPPTYTISSAAELNAELIRAIPTSLTLRITGFFDFPTMFHLDEALETFILDSPGVNLGTPNIDIIVDSLIKCKKIQAVIMVDVAGLTKAHAERLLASLPNLSRLVLQNLSFDAIAPGTVFISHPRLVEVPSILVNGCDQVRPVWLPSLHQARLRQRPQLTHPTVSPHLRVLHVADVVWTDWNATSPGIRESLRYYTSTLHTMYIQDGCKSWLSFDRPWMLQDLSLTGGEWTQLTLNQILQSCPLLVRLRFFSYGKDDLKLSVDDMSWLVHPRLRDVRLQRCFVSSINAVLRVSPETLPMLQKLMILDLNGLNRVCIREHMHLRTLKVAKSACTSSLTVEIQHCPNLSRVDFSDLKHSIDSLSILDVAELRKLKLKNLQLESAIQRHSVQLQLPEGVQFICQTVSSENNARIAMRGLNDFIFIPNYRKP